MTKPSAVFPSLFSWPFCSNKYHYFLLLKCFPDSSLALFWHLGDCCSVFSVQNHLPSCRDRDYPGFCLQDPLLISLLLSWGLLMVICMSVALHQHLHPNFPPEHEVCNPNAEETYLHSAGGSSWQSHPRTKGYDLHLNPSHSREQTLTA